MSDDMAAKKQGLRDEMERLKYEFKVDLPRRISEARAYGDLKENAEYHAARERQSFVKARITQLSQQLHQMNDLNVSNIQRDKIGFGSRVRLLDRDSGNRIEFTFVHPNEVKPSEGKISLSSPVGLALQNRSVGEEVEVNIPAGKKRYFVEKITTIHGEVLEHQP